MRRVAPLLVALFAVACAAGGEDIDEPGTGGGAGSGATGGGGTGALGGAAGSGGAAASGGSAGSAGSGGSGGSAGSSGGGGSAGSSGGGGSGGTGGGACAAVNTCATAQSLGSMSGDTNKETKSTNGTGSTWLTLRVTEDNHSPLGEALELKLSLEVPAGEDLDLYAYVDVAADSTPCGLAPFAKGDSGGQGMNELLTVKWGDGLTGSGNDDGRDVAIEIVHKSGDCSAPWKLNLASNP